MTEFEHEARAKVLLQFLNSFMRPSNEGKSSIFDGAGTTTLDLFLVALSKLDQYIQNNPQTLMLERAVLYVCRYQQLGGAVTEHNVRRLMLASFIVAGKFYEDYPCTNAQMSEQLSLSLKDLLRLETAFLNALGYRLFLDDAGENEVRSLHARIAAAQAGQEQVASPAAPVQAGQQRAVSWAADKVELSEHDMAQVARIRERLRFYRQRAPVELAYEANPAPSGEPPSLSAKMPR